MTHDTQAPSPDYAHELAAGPAPRRRSVGVLVGSGPAAVQVGGGARSSSSP